MLIVSFLSITLSIPLPKAVIINIDGALPIKVATKYFLIDNANYCINNLDYYDTIGCNLINKCDDKSCMIHEKHAYHYSGNFWWSKVSYLKLLVKLEIYEKREEREKKRYQCENWVLSKCDNKNIGVIYQDNTNLHPYHRYIFDNYKKEKLLIKKKKINLN